MHGLYLTAERGSKFDTNQSARTAGYNQLIGGLFHELGARELIGAKCAAHPHLPKAIRAAPDVAYTAQITAIQSESAGTAAGARIVCIDTHGAQPDLIVGTEALLTTDQLATALSLPSCSAIGSAAFAEPTAVPNAKVSERPFASA